MGGITLVQPADVGAIIAAMAAGTSVVRIWDGVTEVDVIAIINALKTDKSSVAGSVVGLAGAGNLGAGTQRVTIATDDYNLARLSAAIAAHLAAGPANAILTAGVAVDGVPAEVAAGVLASPWMDTFRRLVLFGSDLAQSALSVSEVAPAQMQVLVETDWVALTAPGQETPIINIQDHENHTIAYIISFGGCTDVDLIAWGSLDGTNWFKLWEDNITSAEDNPDAITLSGVKARYLKCEFKAENGDTDATVVFQLMSGN